MKRCPKCDTFKEIDAFGKNRSHVDGLECWCRVCRAAAQVAYIEKNRDKISAKAAARYVANREFYLKQTRAYVVANAEKRDAYRRKWYALNIDRYAAKSAALHQATKDKRNAQNLAWMKANREYGNSKAAKRRAMKLNATPAWANLDRVREFYVSSDALGMLTGDWYHVDHIVPLNSKIVCGLHNEFNLQVLPEKENLLKSNRHWPDMP